MTTIVINSPERVAYAGRVIGKLPLDRAWACTIVQHKERRSLKANARLWALHAKAAEHTGFAAEEMHEFALCRHFGFSELRITAPDESLIIRHVPIKRSSARNTKEFGEFMEATEAWYISEFGVFLGDDD